MTPSSRICLLASALMFVAASSAPTVPEYELKAAFLYKFGNFVDIPSTGNGLFTICILGEDPFGAAIDDSVRDKTVASRPVVVRRTMSVEDVRDCAIVFISRSEEPRLATILARLKGAPIVTVADMDGFAAAGGMIGLVLRDNRVRFDINVDAAAKSGVRISAKLLNLARIVSGAKP